MSDGRPDLLWGKSLRLDLSYIDHWSMAGDLLLIATTLEAVVASGGAH
jgi:lipopolysaccharide/colanic/teichoic acid biosynthesis glycosyltransferase